MKQNFRKLIFVSIFITVFINSGISFGQERLWEEFPYDNFDDPVVIDNAWYPLTAGMRYTFEGTFLDEGEEIRRTVITTVTSLTKEIDGIQSLVIWDQDFNDGELVETEIAFFAQDNDGNVWRMGEHPEEYEDGEFVIAPTWIAGQANAYAGILVPGNPDLEAPDFSQGYAEDVEFTDRAFVFAIGEEFCIELDCYENVLIIDEFNPEEEDVFQQKYYAPEIGNIYVGWRGEGDSEQEQMELVKIEQLNAELLDAANQAALALEAHAYEVSEDVYGATLPIQAMSE